MKKLIAVVLAAVTMLSSNIIMASAEPIIDSPIDEIVTEEYQYTSRLGSNLTFSGKTATCNSTVYGFSNTTTKIVITQTLQRQSGSSWYSVASWSKTFNSWYGFYGNTKSSLSSGIYRLKTVAKVYSGSNYETITIYSSTASC